MSFATEIFQSFKRLQTELGFIPAKAISGSRFASMVRCEEDDIFVSIFAKDTMAEGTTIEIWVAPPAIPDDALDRLNVGYRIWIGAEVSPGEEKFQAWQKRIVALLPCIPALIPPIRHEFEDPPIRSGRWAICRQEWEVVRQVHELARKGRIGADKTLEAATEYAKGKLTLKEFKVECTRLASEMSRGNELDPSTIKICIEIGPDVVDALSGMLYSGLYAWGLGELSRRRRRN